MDNKHRNRAGSEQTSGSSSLYSQTPNPHLCIYGLLSKSMRQTCPDQKLLSKWNFAVLFLFLLHRLLWSGTAAGQIGISPPPTSIHPSLSNASVSPMTHAQSVGFCLKRKGWTTCSVADRLYSSDSLTPGNMSGEIYNTIVSLSESLLYYSAHTRTHTHTHT